MNLSVILLEPKHPGNIGSVCRAMKNFGFEELILVNPCKIDKETEYLAVHAKDILKKAKIYKNFSSAVKNFNLVIGTTSKETGKDDYFLRINLSPQELAKKLKNAKGSAAIVFGREDSGLTNSELEKCDFCITIPTSENYRAMNVSHAVAVILYELSKAASRQLPAASPRLASKKEKDLIIKNYAKILENLNYPKQKERRKVFNIMFHKILGRALVTGREANTLIGVLKKINRKLKK